VFSSTQVWAEMLRSWRPRRPVVHLPVGSNIPDRRAHRSRMRESLGAGSGDAVLAAFGTGHPSRRLEYVAAAANAVAQRRGPTLLLNLGANAPTVGGLTGDVRVEAPGALPADKVAAVLAAADVFLAPFVDGVTTRRGSFMAALRAGVAVVATSTPATDDILRNDPGITLVPIGQVDAFADAAVRLSQDGDLRAGAASAVVELYDSQFDWPVLARLLLERLPRRQAP
jgi:glycosyltransferase involved in cell wall biosynthesis